MSTLQSKVGDGLNKIQGTIRQGKQKVATVQEAGQIRQQLDQLRQKRMEQLLALGTAVHKDIRQGAAVDNAYLQLAEPIGAMDRTIYELAKSLELLQQAQTNGDQCPNCRKPVSDDDRFCGSCGGALPVKEEAVVAEMPCTHCEEMIPESSAFCPCCGFSLSN
ncbi:hypothetical protein NCCP2716_30950 [Sporosarcina sp. NCCP-2716]|uniref:zinc ribbon domain-containing protein n=1 Tax=Sporosarcina sp. NCCP-2716 TaxID=2943679 RepID=UPI00203B8A09|nr:zinc ribbon domain-containing protein [Sporosarcina sp. NCCP-2716]GKV70597.1 hypothetical protein NCCP2716_30950 [Sporosarcina sp. NCCP-2716]